MAISENTRNTLNELRAAGYSAEVIAALEKETDADTSRGEALDRRILAQKSFTNYRSQKDQEITRLKSQVNELAALKSSQSSGALLGDPDLLARQDKRIKELEKILIEEEGYDAEQVRSLTLAEHQDFEKLNKAAKETPVNNNNSATGVSKEDLTAGLTNVAYGAISIAAKVAKYTNKAQQLGIEVTDSMYDGLTDAFRKGFETGQNEEQIANSYFGFDTKIREKQAAEAQAKEQAAFERGRTEALKEAGVTLRKSPTRRVHPILDRKPLSATIQRDDNGQIDPENLPKNKVGDPEFFRLRPQSEVERREKHVARASARFNQLLETMDEDGLPLSATA